MVVRVVIHLKIIPDSTKINEEFKRLEMEKLDFLRYLINNYDDGRSKGFCIADRIGRK